MTVDGDFAPLPDAFVSTREALHRVATHILGRRRHDRTGRFGLRVTPGGFGTPAFGDDVEVLRLASATLVHERGKSTRLRPIQGASLDDLAAFAGVDLGVDFSVGRTTPPLADVHAPLPIDPAGAVAVADWFLFGAVALDAALAALGDEANPSVAQLWPEHFDLGCDVAAGSQRVNLGASPGDEWFAEPYLYVGPWARTFSGPFWNAPFGAALTRTELARVADPLERAVEFVNEGVTLVRAGPSQS